jgi:hypothetical protein
MEDWIAIEQLADHGDLLCPRCHSNYLHSGGITAYDREEDAEHTIVTTLDGAQTAQRRMPSLTCNNPSERRHGIAIVFWCESCHAFSELTFAQHKGRTLCAWRDATSPEAQWSVRAAREIPPEPEEVHQ